ncbi:HAMP domain-containing sensor histidine kinase [Agromyces sp. G08B096]|uniref:histidine kinase n=1 Tax=Agromyces sp. G08B096 TaxID=3156399 RepID=A0AAU7W8D8_9MICO
MWRFRLPLRVRLTAVYGALFLVAGLVMLGLTWALVQQRLIDDAAVVNASVCCSSPWEPSPTLPAGDRLTYEYTVQIMGAARDQALGALLTQGSIAVVVVGALAAAAGWVVAGRMLRPLSAITATAARIAAAPEGRRHERLRLDGPRDDVTELADTFDDMLDRLDAAFDAQRRFVANASHELRTPIAVERALVEVAAARPGASDDVRALARELLDVNADQHRLIDGLLLLARSERELAERRFVDLADLAEHATSPAGGVRGDPGSAPGLSRDVAPDAAPEFALELGEAPTAGDPVLLAHLVRNLVENAIRHNLDAGGWVRVATGTDATGRARLEVSNSGPVVAEDAVAGLVEPFRRLGGGVPDRGRTAGAGLGLSIVRAIAEAHGGALHLAARRGGGLVATVTLPREEYGFALDGSAERGDAEG